MSEGVVDGKYQILRQLGQGGMGAVYEAQHVGTGRRVAVKVIISEALSKEKDILVRFQREARASGSIDSQHVVQVLDTGIDPVTNSPYMVMELLSGEDVHDLCKRLGPLPPELVLRIVAQACIGLARAHEKGIVHRDIKSANVFLSRREGGERVLKLLDFGIAKVRGDQLGASENHGLTRTGAMMGSPLYMSPEQARGSKSLDGRSDLYSLGVLMYEALAGSTPNGHCETLGELILAICSQYTEPVQNRAPWVPPEVAAILHKVLEQNPAKRYESAAEMHAAIMALLPNGNTIHESMLVAVWPELRAYVAPRFEPIQAPAPSTPSLSHLASTVAAPTGPGISATGGAGNMAVTDAPTWKPPPSPARWLVPLGAVVVIGAVGAAGFALWPRKTAAARSDSASIAASAAVASAASSGGPLTPTTRTVQVSIAAPPDAKVEVDGRSVDVKEGKIDVLGALGSTHPVRVSASGREARADIAIAESGADPASIELVVPKVGEGGARPVASASAATTATATATTPTVTKPPATQAGGAPTINRTF